MAVLYARATGPYASSSKEAWGMMLQWLDDRDLRGRVARGFGLLRDDPSRTGQFLRRYDACVEVLPGMESDLSSGIGRQTLGGGAYAVYTHVGRHADIAAAFQRFARHGLPAAGHEPDETRGFLEVYLNDPQTTNPAALSTELWIPITGVAFSMHASRSVSMA
jgi:AraC family transcriptional regulator